MFKAAKEQRLLYRYAPKTADIQNAKHLHDSPNETPPPPSHT